MSIENNEYLSENMCLKENAIKLAEHHKKHCDGPECDVNLHGLKRLLQKAGVELTDEEKRHFM